MKPIWSLLCSLFLAATFATSLHAQDLVFTSIQCDPTSCQEEGPAETQCDVTVDFIGYCTGDIVPVLAVNAQAVIGKPVACQTPYIPFALVETSKTQYLDDCGRPYYVSYVTPNAEIINVLGITVFHVDAAYGCDGSETAPIVVGTKPC
jgi:hypothetical protein